MLLYAKIYPTASITTILLSYSLKAFSEKFNVLKVDYDRVPPMERFSVTTIDITIKIATHGDVQFMYWMQYFKAV